MPYTATFSWAKEVFGVIQTTWKVVDEDWNTVSLHTTKEQAESEAKRLNGAEV